MTRGGTWLLAIGGLLAAAAVPGLDNRKLAIQNKRLAEAVDSMFAAHVLSVGLSPENAVFKGLTTPTPEDEAKLGAALQEERKAWDRLVALTPRCTTARVRAHMSRLQAVVHRFREAHRLAEVTPRLSLAPQAERLQGIKQEIEKVPAMPSCVASLQVAAEIATDEEIDALLEFLSDHEMKGWNVDSEYWQKFSAELARQGGR